jgi:hypothetical protein
VRVPVRVFDSTVVVPLDRHGGDIPNALQALCGPRIIADDITSAGDIVDWREVIKHGL